METVLVTLVHRFEDIETITIVDILRRTGARVTLPGVIEGSRGIKIAPDVKFLRQLWIMNLI
jgi:hypothetical protein